VPLPVFVVPAAPLTVAVLVIVPVAVGTTTIVMVALWPGSNVSSCAVMVPADALATPWLVESETSVTPLGKASVRVTSDA
jgi:hypothetical protein